MALQVVGVRLVADDAANYIATLDKTDKAERDVAAGASVAAKGLTLLERAAQDAGERIGHVMVDAAAQAGRAILQWGADGVRAAGDFESGMNSFESVVGGTLAESGQNLEEFRDLFISLGRDLPVSTQEVQQAAIEMAKGGIEPATIAAGGLRQTLQFAGAAGLELADAATIASKTIAGWAAVNATADEKAALLAHSTDLLARAANASTVEVDELALGLYNVQGTARASGATLDETVTTLALLAPNFNSSAEAGNAMENMLLRLQPATAPAAAAMADLGLLTKEGNSAFYDAQGNFIGMRATADKLNKALGGLSQAQKTEALRTIFGNDALNAANTLLEKGAAGYDAMAASIAQQASVAEQARLKQQGFNTAVDNLGGSLEALQITVFTKVLPAFTGIVELVAGGVNAITDYAAATMEGNTALATIASTVSTLALPALVGLTAATTLYGVASGIAAIGGVQNLGIALALVAQRATLAAASITAAAGAAALAALPFVAVGAAAGVAMLKWNEFSEAVTSATEELLNSKPFWTESAAAIAELGNASDATQERLQPLADSIQEQRDLLESNIESLGRRMAAGFVTEAQYNAEMEAINAQAASIGFASDALNGMIQEELAAATAGMTATAEAERLRGATGELGAQAAITAEDIEALGKKIQDTYAKGAEAVQSYASTQSSFLASVETRQAEYAAKIEELESKKNAAVTEDQRAALDEQIAQVKQSYVDQETAAATSYANQQAEQKRHLGQLLIDYTVAQASLGNISKEKAAEITGALEQAYGLQESSVASTFLKMAGSIDSFAADASGDVNTLTQTLADQQQQAADTQKQMDAYAKTYTADAVANFVERKGEADDYISALEAIPEEVQSTLELPAIEARQAEIDAIDGGLRRIPKEVVIRIRVKDEVPDEYKPGSPTPFEIGIRGIQKALGDLAGSAISLPGITTELGNIAGAVNAVLFKSDAPDDAEDLGGNIIEGLAEGMADNIAEAVREAKNAAQAILSQVEDTFDIDSPSGVTMDMGENVMLGLILGMRQQTPDLINQALFTIEGLRVAVTDALEAGNEELADKLESQLNAMADFVEGFAGQVSDALIDAYAGVADFARQLSDNIGDIGGFEGAIQDDVIKQLAEAEAEAAKMSDPAEAAKFLEERSRQIIEEAKLRQEWAEAGAREEERINEEHTRGLEKIEKERRALIDERAEVDQDANKDVAALRARLATAGSDIERGYIQAEIDARLAQQVADRKRIDDQLTLNQQAHDAEMQRYKDEIAQNRALADAERARINQRIALLKKAHEAELAALAEQQAQGGGAQDLIDTIQAVLDAIKEQPSAGPVAAVLAQLLARLNAIPGMASGGAMQAMMPYVVGERGPELVVPGATSYIMANQEMRRAMQPAAIQGGASYQGGILNLGGITINGSGLSEAALRRAVLGAVNDVANASDLRVRMGVA